MAIDWTQQLDEQLDWHWREQARPRLEGLTDEEYLWEPVAGCWSLRRRGPDTPVDAPGSGEWTCDFTFPPPQPEPVTTIAWRLAHVVVGVLGQRSASHFGAEFAWGPADYFRWRYVGTAAEALEQLDATYGAWRAGVAALDAEGLARPVGPAEGDWAEHPMAELVLHINREVIHHLAEVALLRDLYAHR
ncbi:DinB family protein [Auraticoccus sp. F435]|uniref:DinB family protein n=1 Tax=Auraticoccus cholistanensis TaxID=2656650 RepID=A0A6A9UV09_9ACTN|nr:DinB family protein [Auraticoccus cholistanensis]MVA76508.1 DinB family protein [Auraticoccus cholistanensis]